MGLFAHSVNSFLPDRDYLPIAMPTTDPQPFPDPQLWAAFYLLGDWR